MLKAKKESNGKDVDVEDSSRILNNNKNEDIPRGNRGRNTKARKEGEKEGKEGRGRERSILTT